MSSDHNEIKNKIYRKMTKYLEIKKRISKLPMGQIRDFKRNQKNIFNELELKY